MHSERLYLLPYSNEYFEDYFSFIMDAELQESLGLHGVTDRKSARENFDWLIQNRRFYAIVLHMSGKAIGEISLHPCTQTVLNLPELRNKSGYSVSIAVSADYQRMGYAAEAMALLIEMLFQQEQIDYIEYAYLPSNAASCALQKKLGFSHRCTQVFDGLILNTSILRNHAESFHSPDTKEDPKCL